MPNKGYKNVEEKEMLIDFIPYMFDPREKEDMVIVQMINSGIGGILMMLGAFFAPLALIFYPQIRKLFFGRQ